MIFLLRMFLVLPPNVFQNDTLSIVVVKTKCEIGIEKSKGYLARFERCSLRQ
jgi:hypothetical protein